MDKSGLEDKKIIVWDHNRDLMNHRANVILMTLRRQNMLGNGISLV
jgi:erythromycin esterase-like protein